MPRPGAEYYRAINQQKTFARNVGLDPERFTYPYSSFSDYHNDKSSHYYNADLKLVKSTSVGNHHEDCDEPECGTSNWYCDLCSDLNIDIGFEPAGVSEVYSGCGRSSVQCMLLLECDDEVSPLPHNGGTRWDSDLQLDYLRTDSTPVPVSDEYEPAVVKFADELDSEQPAIDLDIKSADLSTSASSETIELVPSDVIHQRGSDGREKGPHHSLGMLGAIHEMNINKELHLSASVLILSLFLVMCFPILCLLTNSSILAKASLLTIAHFPNTIIFVFDRGKRGRGFSV